METPPRLEPTFEEALPVPWENAELGVIRRFWSTIGAAFSPIQSSTSFALSSRIGRPIAFAILTWLPLALVQGIIPFTHRLRFGSGLSVTTVDSPESFQVDLWRAIGLGMIMATATWLGIALSYVSLSRAYGKPQEGAVATPTRAAWRAIFYSSWLLPFINAPWVEEGMPGIGGVGFHLVGWALPESAGFGIAVAAHIVYLFPLVILFIRLRHVARASCGVGSLASFAVALVPLFLVHQIELHLIGALDPWLPEPPTPPE